MPPVLDPKVFKAYDVRGIYTTELDEDGVLHEWEDELAGEAMPGGPVVLSWDAAAHDRNVERRVARERFVRRSWCRLGPDGVRVVRHRTSTSSWSTS